MSAPGPWHAPKLWLVANALREPGLKYGRCLGWAASVLGFRIEPRLSAFAFLVGPFSFSPLPLPPPPSPCSSVWGFAFLGQEELLLYCTFRAFATLLHELKGNLYYYRASPIPAWMVSVGIAGGSPSPTLSYCGKGRQGWHVHSCMATVGTGGRGLAQAAEWLGDCLPSISHRDAQPPALGKGPGNLSLDVASLIVCVLQSWSLFIYFFLPTEQLGICEPTPDLLGNRAGFWQMPWEWVVLWMAYRPLSLPCRDKKVSFLGYLFLQIKTVVNLWGPEASPILGGGDSLERCLE